MSIITFTPPVAIESPCIGVCALDVGRSYCTGCGRTTDEIARWTSGTPEWRRAVMAELPARRVAATQSLASDCK